MFASAATSVYPHYAVCWRPCADDRPPIRRNGLAGNGHDRNASRHERAVAVTFSKSSGMTVSACRSTRSGSIGDSSSGPYPRRALSRSPAPSSAACWKGSTCQARLLIVPGQKALKLDNFLCSMVQNQNVHRLESVGSRFLSLRQFLCARHSPPAFDAPNLAGSPPFSNIRRHRNARARQSLNLTRE